MTDNKILEANFFLLRFVVFLGMDREHFDESFFINFLFFKLLQSFKLLEQS